MVAVNAGYWERGLLRTTVTVNVNRCGASTLEAIVARCQGNWGVDERDVRLRERLRKRAVNVEEAASDRELRDLHRLCELRRSVA